MIQRFSRMKVPLRLIKYKPQIVANATRIGFSKASNLTNKRNLGSAVRRTSIFLVWF